MAIDGATTGAGGACAPSIELVAALRAQLARERTGAALCAELLASSAADVPWRGEVSGLLELHRRRGARIERVLASRAPLTPCARKRPRAPCATCDRVRADPGAAVRALAALESADAGAWERLAAWARAIGAHEVARVARRAALEEQAQLTRVRHWLQEIRA